MIIQVALLAIKLIAGPVSFLLSLIIDLVIDMISDALIAALPGPAGVGGALVEGNFPAVLSLFGLDAIGAVAGGGSSPRMESGELHAITAWILTFLLPVLAIAGWGAWELLTLRRNNLPVPNPRNSLGTSSEGSFERAGGMQANKVMLLGAGLSFLSWLCAALALVQDTDGERLALVAASFTFGFSGFFLMESARSMLGKDLRRYARIVGLTGLVIGGWALAAELIED
jgi:hypothetical protein